MSLQVQARIYRRGKMMRAACLLFWLTALAARAEPPSIDNANFGEVVTASRQPFVIEFYSEMCGSCKEFAPTWHAFAARLESVAGLGLGRVCVDKPPGVMFSDMFLFTRDLQPEELSHLGNTIYANKPVREEIKKLQKWRLGVGPY